CRGRPRRVPSRRGDGERARCSRAARRVRSLADRQRRAASQRRVGRRRWRRDPRRRRRALGRVARDARRRDGRGESRRDGSRGPICRHPRRSGSGRRARDGGRAVRPLHFIGVGGAGMSVIAALFAARGAAVSGSDARDGAVLAALRERGVTVWLGHDAAHVDALPGDARVVVSSAVRESNPELAAARARGLEVLHRSEALALLMAGERVVAVAGAHGKTTTSAMLAVALREAGLDPSFAIGGSVMATTTSRPSPGDQAGVLSGAGAGSGGIFVAEADESDGSFLAYEPFVALVTHLEPDHLDHFGSREAFEQVFADFAARIRTDGALVACADDEGSLRLAERVRAEGRVRVITYGTSPDAEFVLDPDSATVAGPEGSARLELAAP